MSEVIHMIRTDEVARVGLYSSACLVEGNRRTLYIAGNVGADREGKTAGDGLDEQLRQTFVNIGKLLAEVGMDFSNIVRFTTYLVSPDDIEEFYRVRADVFSDLYPTGEFPVNTLLIVNRLVHAEYLVELDAVAAD
jgi:2-iminobutanoate/2-iminopropanoate deaminase